MMRYILLVVVALLLLVEEVTGRRSSSTPPATPTKREVMQRWGYPYGWGLPSEPTLDMPPKEEEVKPVKRVVKETKKATKPECRKGRFGMTKDPEHPHWKDYEDAMDGDME